jgi:hypothetical protein
MQKPISIAVHIGVLALMLLAVFCPADAWAQGYWHPHYYSQYDYRNVLSPCSYIYPEADWRPFFNRVRHYGPIVLLLPHSPCYVY